MSLCLSVFASIPFYSVLCLAEVISTRVFSACTADAVPDGR